MKAFKTLTSPIAVLPRRDVDTDMIIPAQHLTSTSRDGYGQHLFAHLRAADSEFFLNKQNVHAAKILVADENFGCGSSREHAVWALMDAGFEVIIAKSFADIFKSNSAKNGLLLVSLPADQVDELFERKDAELTVDLELQTVKLPDGTTITFDYDPFRKRCLLQGLDDLDYILSNKKYIEQFRTSQKGHSFYSTLKANHQ